MGMVTILTWVANFTQLLIHLESGQHRQQWAIPIKYGCRLSTQQVDCQDRQQIGAPGRLTYISKAAIR